MRRCVVTRIYNECDGERDQIREFKVIIFKYKRKIRECKIIFSVNYIDTGGEQCRGDDFQSPSHFP